MKVYRLKKLEEAKKEPGKFDFFDPDDQESVKKIKRRITQAHRTADIARAAAADARKQGNDEKAEELLTMAQELDDWAAGTLTGLSGIERKKAEQSSSDSDNPEQSNSKDSSNGPEKPPKSSKSEKDNDLDDSDSDSDSEDNDGSEDSEDGEDSENSDRKNSKDESEESDDESDGEDGDGDESDEDSDDEDGDGESSGDDEEDEDADEEDDESEGGKEPEDETDDEKGESKNKSKSKDKDPEEPEDEGGGGGGDGWDINSEDDEEDEDDESGSGKKSKGKNKSSNTDDDDDDDADDDSDDEDEEDDDNQDNGKKSKSTNNDSDSDDEDSDDEDEDDEEEDDIGDPGQIKMKKNPFNQQPWKDKQIMQQLPNMPPMQVEEEEMTHDEKIKAMKKVLARLNSAESRGAKDALNSLLGKNKDDADTQTDAQESFKKIISSIPLQEALLNITNDIGAATDDEYDSIINRVLDSANEVSPLEITGQKERDERVGKIKRDAANKIKNNELSKEDARLISNEIKADNAFKAAEREKLGLLNLNMPSSEEFKDDLENVVSTQLRIADEEEEDSWAQLNRRHQGTSILKPGSVLNDIEREEKPLIQVYMDCSVSFDPSDIRKEENFLSGLMQLEREDRIEVELVYFTDELYATMRDAMRSGRGTGAWYDIIQNIKRTQPDNIVIITDGDMEYSAKYNSNAYDAPGCVWFIWKGVKAPSLPKRVSGLQGTFEYRLV